MRKGRARVLLKPRDTLELKLARLKLVVMQGVKKLLKKARAIYISQCMVHANTEGTRQNLQN